MTPPGESGREGEKIYTRNYGKPNRSGVKYNPPPGYDGNAFSGTPDVKLHEAEDDVTRLPRRSRENTLPEQTDAAVSPEEERFDLFDDTPPSYTDESKPEPDEKETKPPEPLPPSETESLPAFGSGVQAFEALFHHLRGKFGREELIIVLVMLLIASDGASIELMLLALILIAG